MNAAQKQISMVPEVDAQYLIANIEKYLLQLKALAQHEAVIASPVEKWMTPEEAAEHCRYSRSTFDRYVADGTIPCYRVTPDSDPRFLPSKLNEFLEGRKSRTRQGLR